MVLKHALKNWVGFYAENKYVIKSIIYEDRHKDFILYLRNLFLSAIPHRMNEKWMAKLNALNIDSVEGGLISL